MRQRHPEGGAIELISMPTYDAASRRTTARLLVRGFRYVEVAASQLISTLEPGHRLQLQTEPGNVANHNAIQITHGRLHLWYVPDALVGYVAAVLAARPHQHRSVETTQHTTPQDVPVLRTVRLNNTTQHRPRSTRVIRARAGLRRREPPRDLPAM